MSNIPAIARCPFPVCIAHPVHFTKHSVQQSTQFFYLSESKK